MNTRPWLLLVAAISPAACAPAPREPAPPMTPAPLVQPAATTTLAAAPQQLEPPASPENARPPAPAPAPVSAQPPAAPSQLRWRIEIAPSTMSMAGRAKCRVRLSVTNEGSQSVQPDLHQGRFTVDGQASMASELAFGNGTMDQRWMSLPPHQTAVAERELCEDLFPAPGKYTVGFRIGGELVSAAVTVTR